MINPGAIPGRGAMKDVLSGEKRWIVLTGEWQSFACDLPDKCVDHVITDPPYSAYVHSKSRAGARKTPLHDGNGRVSPCTLSREVEFGFEPITTDDMEAVGDMADRLVRRWTMAFCDVESTHLWTGALTSAGLDYCRTMAWIKIGATPQFTGDRPGVGFETIVLAHSEGRKRWNGGGKAGVYSALTVIERGGVPGKHANNRREHPTQKPDDLMCDLIRDFTDPDDIILDPFCGSGTTGVAAIRLGRRFIGIEKKPKWADVARERLAAEAENSSPAARKAGQLPMFREVP